MTPIEQTFRDSGVLRTGHFRLSSGKHSDTYLQCQRALGDPARALELGRSLAEQLDAGQIDVVVSPALGGVLAGFAVAAALGKPFLFSERAPGDPQRTMVLRRGQTLEPGQRALIVEDVVTTGGSAMEVAALVEEAGAKVAGLAAIVDRSGGLPDHERPPLPVSALLTVAPRAYQPEACPLCAAGTPLDAPGSRHSVAPVAQAAPSD